MVRGTSHHAPIRQDAKAVPFTFLLINRTSLGSFYLRLFAFVHVCALHIGVVALVAAQAPSAEDYTVAACDANSRADAIARCEQRWPAGRYRLVTPYTYEQMAFSKSAAFGSCPGAFGHYVNAEHLRNEGTPFDPRHMCHWRSGPASGDVFPCEVESALVAPDPNGGAVHASYRTGHGGDTFVIVPPSTRRSRRLSGKILQ